MQQDIKKEKDAWDVATREFTHYSYFGGFAFLVFLVLYLSKAQYEFLNLWTIALSFVLTLASYGLADLFKKRDKKAVTFAYIGLAALIVWDLLDGIDIFTFLIFGYLLYRVYQADKSVAVS